MDVCCLSGQVVSSRRHSWRRSVVRVSSDGPKLRSCGMCTWLLLELEVCQVWRDFVTFWCDNRSRKVWALAPYPHPLPCHSSPTFTYLTWCTLKWLEFWVEDLLSYYTFSFSTNRKCRQELMSNLLFPPLSKYTRQRHTFCLCLDVDNPPVSLFFSFTVHTTDFTRLTQVNRLLAFTCNTCYACMPAADAS